MVHLLSSHEPFFISNSWMGFFLVSKWTCLHVVTHFKSSHFVCFSGVCNWRNQLWNWNTVTGKGRSIRLPKNVSKSNILCDCGVVWFIYTTVLKLCCFSTLDFSVHCWHKNNQNGMCKNKNLAVWWSLCDFILLVMFGYLSAHSV